MSPYVPRRPGTRSLAAGSPLVYGLAGLLVLLLVVFWAFGIIDFSRSKQPSTAGLVPVPTVARRIPAYTRLTRDHLWDVTNARISVVYLPPRAVTREMLVNLTDVIGRVLSHDKAPGYVFTEDDFLPKGTREGIVAGIPPGKRAVRVAADKVEGLYGLHAGDRFDLLATMAVDATRGGGGQPFGVAGVYSEQLALQARLSNWQKQATVRVMVQNALIIEPMATRGVPAASSSLTENGVTRVRPVQEAVIAINPDEVARLAEAIAVDAKITAVPRSGRPDDEINSRTPDLRPVSPFAGTGSRAFAGRDGEGGEDAPQPFRIVETIMGQKRELTAVPKP